MHTYSKHDFLFQTYVFTLMPSPFSRSASPLSPLLPAFPRLGRALDHTIFAPTRALWIIQGTVFAPLGATRKRWSLLVTVCISPSVLHAVVVARLCFDEAIRFSGPWSDRLGL